MPRTSISADHVDRVLPPAQIAAELAQLAGQFRQPLVQNLEAGLQAGEQQHLARILTLLRTVSGVDFRLYRPSTIHRRIARRMLLHRIQSLAEYAAYVQGNYKELRDLQEDALINVTRFFRDPPVFDALKEVVLPRIFDDRQADQQVRVWVAAVPPAKRCIPSRFACSNSSPAQAVRAAHPDFRNRRQRAEYQQGTDRHLFGIDRGEVSPNVCGASYKSG